MSGVKHYFKDDLVGTGLEVRVHMYDEGDLWLAITKDKCTDWESVLLSKEEAGRLAEVLQRYASA